MNAFLTVTAFLVLIAVGAFVIHRLNTAHAERIALRHYGHGRSGGPRHGTGAMAPPPGRRPSVSPAVLTERRDHRDGGRGRFPARRRRERTTHHR